MLFSFYDFGHFFFGLYIFCSFGFFFMCSSCCCQCYRGKIEDTTMLRPCTSSASALHIQVHSIKMIHILCNILLLSLSVWSITSRLKVCVIVNAFRMIFNEPVLCMYACTSAVEARQKWQNEKEQELNGEVERNNNNKIERKKCAT